MNFRSALFATLFVAFCSAPALADEMPPAKTSAQENTTFMDKAVSTAKNTFEATLSPIQSTLDQALDLIGIKYRRGGTSPEAGFDCSGFVSHVFREGLGMILPRTSREMSMAGEAVPRDELKPGDLVFFNTMRHAFSHVGIYLGDNLFVHSPRAGSVVRIEDLRESYWVKRYNGARRVNQE